MKHVPSKLVFLAVVALFLSLGSSCRGVQINQIEKRVAQLETRVAVLESQVASQPKK